MATSLALDISLVQAPTAAAAERCPGTMLSDLILSIAAVESTKMVYLWPLSCLWSMVLSARYTAYASVPKTSWLVPK